MRDEHFYTRAIEINPSNPEYYIGRARWYCIEHDYEKAYKDYMFAKKLGANIEEDYRYPTCKDYIQADVNIKDLTKRIKKDLNNFELFEARAYYFLLRKDYKNAIQDMEQAITLNPCSYMYKKMDKLLISIREYKIFDCVRNAKKKDLINALKLRLEFAQESLRSCKIYKRDYWRKRADLDFDKIIELSKDKALALYLKVIFFENLKDIRSYKGNKRYANIAISTCKKVVEQSKSRTDKLGKILTYLYEVKLVSLYSDEEDFEQATQSALQYSEKPTYQEIKKGLKYINNFAFMYGGLFERNDCNIYR